MPPYEIDDSKMPVRLGSALRVPDYAYPRWGIPLGSHREGSDKAYMIEWKGGSPQQMQYVIEALKFSRLGNFSQMLRDHAAKVVAHRVVELLKQPKSGGRVNYMDIGAGVSTVNAFDAIPDDYKGGVFITLVEPSEERMAESAIKPLEQRGLRIDRDFRVIVAPDQHLPDFVRPGTQDIISYVATLHHHAYIDTPLAHAKIALKKGGALVIADWHNPEWEHPNRVYRALLEDFPAEEFGWGTRERDLAAFAEMFPGALETAPELAPLDEASYMEIRQFWVGWARARKAAIEAGTFDPRDDIFMLEGHRPVERQSDALKDAGFCLCTDDIGTMFYSGIIGNNPHQLRPESRILMTTVAQNLF